MLSSGSVAIDLGTVNTLVWVDGRGLVLEEPSTIAVDESAGSVAAIGTAAEALADKEPKDIRVIHPLRDGVIADLDATAEMLHGFLRKSGALGGLFKRRVVVCVPGGATWVERRSVVAAFSDCATFCAAESTLCWADVLLGVAAKACSAEERLAIMSAGVVLLVVSDAELDEIFMNWSI